MKANLYPPILLLLFATNDIAAITCSNPQEECIEPGGTRMVGSNHDIPLNLPCWRYRKTYECTADTNNNHSCQQLITAGCSPATTICAVKWGNGCAVKEITYDCPTRQCDGHKKICNDPNAYCATGNCMPSERGKDNDINRSLAALSAAAEAAKFLDTSNPDQVKIFGGKARECSINIASSITKDCCGISASGFLEGNLLKCEAEELEIAHAKEAGRTVELGEYCHNEVFGICTSTHKTYCLYQSKLARILQVGARAQLGISFGDPENPNCRALTQDEFSRVDFSKIDFSEFYKDIENKMKLNPTTQITQKAKEATEEYKKQAEDAKGNVARMREKMQSKLVGAQKNTEALTETAVSDREKLNKNGW